jgi:hypothetical protein
MQIAGTRKPDAGSMMKIEECKMQNADCRSIELLIEERYLGFSRKRLLPSSDF